MRTRLFFALLLATALACMMVTVGPAVAEPKVGKGPPPCSISVYGGSAEVPSGRRVAITSRWAAKTHEQVLDFLVATEVSVTIDGQPVALANEFGEEWIEGYVDYNPGHPEIDIPPVVVETGWYPNVTQVGLHRPLPPGSHIVGYQLTFTADHFDGAYHALAGDTWGTQLELVVTPAEMFPVGGYDQTCAP